eukprot:scaffold40343_cov69-Phaeocystis_antarctica.AAC.1
MSQGAAFTFTLFTLFCLPCYFVITLPREELPHRVHVLDGLLNWANDRKSKTEKARNSQTQHCARIRICPNLTRKRPVFSMSSRK